MLSGTLSQPKCLPKQHREHRGTQSIVNLHYKLGETSKFCAFEAKKDLSEWIPHLIYKKNIGHIANIVYYMCIFTDCKTHS